MATAREAAKIIRAMVPEGIKVRARAVSFEDLARGERVFVSLAGAPPYSDRAFWQPLQDAGRDHGFSVD